MAGFIIHNYMLSDRVGTAISLINYPMHLSAGIVLTKHFAVSNQFFTTQ